MFLDIKKNIYMKNIAWYFRFCVLTLCCVMAGCSDDDNTPQKPTFPELQKINCEVGQTTEIEFEASADWKLTSSSLWCQFIIDDEAMNSCSGTAGKQKVEIQINDNASELNKAYKAEISLWMNGFSNVIFEVTRPTEGYHLVLKDEKGNIFTEENPLTISYDGKESYSVEANFDWKFSKWPEWMSASTSSGAAGDNSRKISPAIASGHTKNANTGVLTFVNAEGEELVKVPVKYEGIPEDKIEFSTGTNRWNWSFSADGKTYASSSGTSGSTTWLDAPLPLTVVAKADNYKIVCLEVVGGLYKHVDAKNWYEVSDAKNGSIQITAAANKGEDERKGCLMIFPTVIYNQIGDNKFDEMVIPNGVMNTSYEDKYTAIEYKQSGAPIGFKIMDESDNRIPVTALTEEGMTEDQLEAKYGVSNVYRLTLNQAYNRLAAEAIGFSGAYCMVNTTFSEGANWTGVSVESSWKGGKFSIASIPADATGEMIIAVQDGNGFRHGVLIVCMKTVSTAVKMKRSK